MIASLPMYDWPEVREATDQWWARIARHAGLSIALSRDGAHDAPWRSPDLILSQTCGYPFTHAFRGKLKLIGTPHYAAAGCEGHRYSSFIFAREKLPLSSFRGKTAAVNSPESMSGMLALKASFHAHADHGRFFGSVLQTGGHLKSLEAVREGRADVCATDSVCVALLNRYKPALLEGLVEIARSPLVPGLPYVTIAGDVERLQSAILSAINDPSLDRFREQLFIDGFSVTTEADYNKILTLESTIEASGGLVLL